MALLMWIPIDAVQAENCLNDSLGYPGFHGAVYANVACETLGYRLIKEVEVLYRDDTPQHLITRWREELKKYPHERDRSKEIHHCWLKGWVCEVERIEGSVREKSEPKLVFCTQRIAVSEELAEEIHLECRFDDGQKFAAIHISSDFQQLATRVETFLNSQQTESMRELVLKHLKSEEVYRKYTVLDIDSMTDQELLNLLCVWAKES